MRKRRFKRLDRVAHLVDACKGISLSVQQRQSRTSGWFVMSGRFMLERKMEVSMNLASGSTPRICL